MVRLGCLAEFEAACPNRVVRARVLFSSAEDTSFLCPEEMVVNVKFYWESSIFHQKDGENILSKKCSVVIR